MPNGGSDCCGTCWFNQRNKDEAGYDHSDDPEPNFCTIRGLAIENAFWTYCGNHPHHRPDRDRIPIGPVFVVGDGPGMYPREVWQPSPDSEEIRLHLLELLAELAEPPTEPYSREAHVAWLVIWQLGEFREARAIPGLTGIADWVPDSSDTPVGGQRTGLIESAREALEKIRAGDLA
jgi:hypothetical protein